MDFEIGVLDRFGVTFTTGSGDGVRDFGECDGARAGDVGKVLVILESFGVVFSIGHCVVVTSFG